MSMEALNWARRQNAGCAGAKFVLFMIADRADEHWSCFPSVPVLAAETQLSERSVFRHLEKLEKYNLIAIVRIPGRRNRYVVNPTNETLDHVRQVLGVTPDKMARPPAESVTPDNLSPLTKTTVTPDKNDNPPTPPIKINPQGNPQKKHSEANASGAASAPSDPKAVVFSVGLEALGGSQSARGLLARMVRDHGDEAVADAVLAMVAEQPGEPKSWLVRACQQRGAKRPRAGPEWLDEHAFDEPLDLDEASTRQREWFERRAGPEHAGFGKPSSELRRPRMYPPGYRGRPGRWAESPQ